MKKKLMAVICIAMAALMCVTLFACNDGMFDGDFTEPAPAVKAREAWNAASEAINGGVAEAALADEDENVRVKGWTGVSFEVNAEKYLGAGYDDASVVGTGKVNASGSMLFDMSGFALNGTVTGSVNDTALDIKLGAYMQNNVYYADMVMADTALQAKADASDSSIIPDANSILGSMLTGISGGLAAISIDYTGEILSAFPYDELEEMGMKTYIDESGDYTRIKFQLPVELIARLQDDESEDSFAQAILSADISLIIAVNKDNGNFAGAKIDMGYEFKGDIGGANAGTGTRMSLSFSDCTAVEGYPANMTEFKDISEFTSADIIDFFTELSKNMGALLGIS